MLQTRNGANKYDFLHYSWQKFAFFYLCKKYAVVKFKYSEKIDTLGITNCPPNDCSVVESVDIFYRWVFEHINHKDNFIPVLEINPKRIDKPKFNTTTKKCSGFALSMHDSLENSLNHFYNILSEQPNLFQFVGNHIVALKIDINDGYRTIPSKKYFDRGHFDFFEQKNINWIERVSDTIKIEDEK